MPYKWNPFTNNLDYVDDTSGFLTGITITTDSGSAAWTATGSLLGGTNTTTSASGSTITVDVTGGGLTWSNQGSSVSVVANTGSFATAAITLTTPVSAGLTDGVELQFVATNGVLVIQLAATQVAHLGNVATTAAGTLTSAATGDSITLRYQSSTNDWWATASIGTWVLA